MRQVGIIGNPNSGKSALFNVLTGSDQRVGNWPGVTVERQEGRLQQVKTPITLIDLPGIYALQVDADSALDAKVAWQYIQSQQAERLLNIVDGSQLERHLYLTLQLRELNIPMIVVVNMMDVVHARGLRLDCEALSKALGCPVVGVVATQRATQRAWMATLLQTLEQQDLQQTRWPALPVSDEAVRERYQQAQRIAQSVVRVVKPHTETLTDRIDRIVLNRYAGVPIFLGVMYLFFVCAINMGGLFQDFFDMASTALCITWPTAVLHQVHAPGWLIALIAEGLGLGINTVLTFIPVVGGLFLCLSLLEDSGYMARAAFVIDRLMRALGLPGRAFVPMIVGFGCNVPAVMGARTLSHARDRILTVLMTPFMSCGARLAIFAVFVSTFFPHAGGRVLFGLYMVGILLAMLTGWLLRHTVLEGAPAPTLMELPTYHMPHVRTIGQHTWHRLKRFLWRAGSAIVPICVLLGGLNSVTPSGQWVAAGSSQSVLAAAGRWLTPVFAPMGIQADNWPATVGLLTGVLAKEVVIGTLNTLYTAHVSLYAAPSQSDLIAGFHDVAMQLKAAVSSIPAHLQGFGEMLRNPIAASSASGEMSLSAHHMMQQQFGGQAAVVAYLLFVLLYFPCISTLAVIRREIGAAWGWFAMLWSTGSAYAMAVLWYQWATVRLHGGMTLIWTGIVCAVACGVFWMLRQQGRLGYRFDQHAPVIREASSHCGGGCAGCPVAETD